MIENNPRLAAVIATLPEKSGVYMMKNAEGKIIYIGKALSLKDRVSSYFHSYSSMLPKTAALSAQIHDIEIILTSNELEALILEATLIKKHRPYFNIDLKDDKRYPFIELSLSDPFPRIFISRRRTARSNRLFGPYTSSDSVKKVIALIRRCFKIRTCRDHNPTRVRPCLNFQIGKCSAPCANLITKEDYDFSIKSVIAFLEGRYEQLVSMLRMEMEQEAQKLHFERCAAILNDIKAIEKIAGEQKVYFDKKVDSDYIAFYQEGTEMVFQVFMLRDGKLADKRHFLFACRVQEEDSSKIRAFLMHYYDGNSFIPPHIYTYGKVEGKAVVEDWLKSAAGRKVTIHDHSIGVNKKLIGLAFENSKYNFGVIHAQRLKEDKTVVLLELAQLLGINGGLNRIETYDISNTGGKEAVGSMSVFKKGHPSKSDYRRFKIKTKETPDDFAMLREVLLRRFTIKNDRDEWKKEKPDLIVIDGGKGQLSSALAILEELKINIPVIGLAKKLEEIFLPDVVEPLIIPPGSGSLNLLRYARDEAHRFAIGYHRLLRGKVFKA